MAYYRTAFALVFGRFWYVAGAAIVAVLFFFFSVWLRNFSFLSFLLTSGAFEFSVQARWLTLGTLGFFARNFTTARAVVLIATSLLVGANAALLIYHLRQRASLARAAGAGLLGTVTAVLGVGCASCGSVALTSLLGLSAGGAVLGVLPWQGLEFGIAGAALLSYSVLRLAQKIQSSWVCR